MSHLQRCRDQADLAFTRLSPRQRNQLAKLALRVAAADGAGRLLSPDYLTEALAVFHDLAPTMAHEVAELVAEAQPMIHPRKART